MIVDTIAKISLEALCKVFVPNESYRIFVYDGYLCITFQNNSIDYSLIHRCVCPSGFRKIGTTGSDECEDIDECFHNPDICGEGGECRNIQGKKNTIILLFSIFYD